MERVSLTVVVIAIWNLIRRKLHGLLDFYLTLTFYMFRLIDYAAFVESMFILWSVSALLWLRFKRPDMNRPIKVSLLDKNRPIKVTLLTDLSKEVY